MPLVVVLCAPVAGLLLDRWGRQLYVLLIANIVTIVAYVLLLQVRGEVSRGREGRAGNDRRRENYDIQRFGGYDEFGGGGGQSCEAGPSCDSPYTISRRVFRT